MRPRSNARNASGYEPDGAMPASGNRKGTPRVAKRKPAPLPPGLDLLTADEAAALLRRKPNTLQGWREEGIGPAYVQQGCMPPLYRRDDLVAWIQAHRVEPSRSSPRRPRRRPA